MKPRITLCTEDSMHTRGGVSVLVDELIHGLSGTYGVLLASRDRTENLPAHLVPLIEEHIPVDDATTTPAGRTVFANALRRKNVDLAHFHLPGVYGWGTRLPRHSPIPFVKKAGIACVATNHMGVNLLHGYCEDSRPDWQKLLLLPRSWIPKMNALRFLDAEIAVSNRNYEQFRNWYFPLRGRFRKIYHSRIRAAALTGIAGQREKAILAVGHVAFRKGQNILVEAFAQIADRFPDWHLWIIGHAVETSCWSQMEQIVQMRGLTERVKLMGGRGDAVDWMKRAAIYVQPSLFEGLPLSLQEALAGGCPSIATRISGNDELVVEGVNGLFVPPGDAAAMSEKLSMLISDPASRQRLSAAAPVTIMEKKMTYESMVKEHIILYDSILSQRTANA